MNDMHGIIFAYSANPKLKELTEHRTVASIPFGGRYRVIDFMLSNMVNAGVTDVGVIMRENYQSLLDHLGSGKDWDLSRKRGGLRLLPPFGFPGGRRDAFFQGKMEALTTVSSYLGRIRQEYVVLADSDVIVNLPLDEIFDAHVASAGDITVICSDKAVGEPETAAFFVPGKSSRAIEVLLGRTQPGAYEGVGVYIMKKKLLEELCLHCGAHNLYDFERDVLQAMTERLNINIYVYSGYSARIQSTASFFNTSMNILKKEIRDDIFNKERPIKTKVRDESSTYYGDDAILRNCVVADGCRIEGSASGCVIFRDVRIDAGAKVRNSILMQGCHVCSGAELNYAIADKEVTINKGRMLMGHGSYPIAISKGSIV